MQEKIYIDKNIYLNLDFYYPSEKSDDNFKYVSSYWQNLMGKLSADEFFIEYEGRLLTIISYES